MFNGLKQEAQELADRLAGIDAQLSDEQIAALQSRNNGLITDAFRFSYHKKSLFEAQRRIQATESGKNPLVRFIATIIG